MPEITLFENPQLGKVRVIMQGEDPWFVAKDVCDCLGYINSRRAICDHCKKAIIMALASKQLFSGSNEMLPLMTNGSQSDCSPLAPQTELIPESDLYRLIMHRKLPAANAFLNWVVEEVLPSIRKHGVYMPNFNDPLDAARAWIKAEEEKRKTQLEARAAQSALVQKSAALSKLLNEWGEGETFRSVIAESKNICKYYIVKFKTDPEETVYREMGRLMTQLCNGGYNSSDKSCLTDERFVEHRFEWKYESHPSSRRGGWNVYHIYAWAYLYDIIEQDGAASIPYVGKYAKGANL